jgi:hypothetical protein
MVGFFVSTMPLFVLYTMSEPRRLAGSISEFSESYTFMQLGVITEDSHSSCFEYWRIVLLSPLEGSWHCHHAPHILTRGRWLLGNRNSTCLFAPSVFIHATAMLQSPPLNGESNPFHIAFSRNGLKATQLVVSSWPALLYVGPLPGS